MIQDQDPLFVGMTRPAMLAGVTYSGIIINMVVVTVTFLMTKAFSAYLLGPPIHITMWLLCKWEPRFFDLLMVWLNTKAPAPHRNVWKGSCYTNQS